jgi:LuxR family maltose regulon positive regulatory protein
MRAHGRLVEIRADQLRYTVTEAAGLLAALGVVLTAESVGRLVDRTEGWAAGLQLAALTLRGRPDADSLVADFGVAHRYVIDYLADEVLAQSPDDVRTFLERTSVAERVCAGLADALTCGSDGDRMLREVEGRNLFLVALGADRTWYRYHHLFADYLRSRLEDEERRELQLRAARWCDERGLTVEATRYALASGRWPEATPIVATGARVALEHGEPATVLRSTAALPGAALSASADLLASRAWAAYLTGQMPVAAAAAAELANLDDGRLEGPVAGRARGVRAWLAVLDRRPVEGERLARAALESLGDDPFFRGLVLLALSDATWDLGRVDENAAAVREALRLARERTPTLATYLTGFIHAIGCNEQGRRPEGERVSRDLLAASTDSLGRVAPAAGPVRVGLGMLAYEGNDLATAASELEAGFAMCRRLGIDFLLGGDSRRARAMTRLATGGAESAREAAEEGLRMASEALPGTRVPAAEAVDALVALQTGDRRRALQWAEGVLADPGRAEMSPPNVRLYRDLTLARVLLATGSASRAETIALEAERYAEWAGTVLGRIQALILAASAAEQAGRRAEARARLSDAVTLAAPGGYVRRFVEDAPPLAHLLPTVRIAAPAFVDAVIEAIDAEAVRVAPGRSTGGSAWSASDGALLELLTQRELDVLRLVARGRSNAGIGDALGVSPGTAKWHVANVLGKLGVSSRTHAAARARELGLV